MANSTDPALLGPRGDPVRVGVERSREEKARFRYLSTLEQVLRNALQGQVDGGKAQLPAEKTVDDMVQTESKSWIVTCVENLREDAGEDRRTARQVPIAGIAEDLSVENVHAERLAAWLGLDKPNLEARLRGALTNR